VSLSLGYSQANLPYQLIMKHPDHVEKLPKQGFLCKNDATQGCANFALVQLSCNVALHIQRHFELPRIVVYTCDNTPSVMKQTSTKFQFRKRIKIIGFRIRLRFVTTEQEHFRVTAFVSPSQGQSLQSAFCLW